MPHRPFLRRWCPVLAICVASLLTDLTQPCRAATQKADTESSASLCLDAIHAAERRHGLPAGLLIAIGEVESGRTDATGHVKPWPWTVQSSGQSLYFANKDAALQWVEDAMAHGVTSIDVGCLQVSLHYHPRAFQMLSEAFEPSHNADYAAQFLHELHAATGNWRQAVGFYHSQTSTLAAQYETRVEDRLNGLTLPRPRSMKPSTTFVRLVSAWQATLAPANPPAGSDWSVLIHQRPHSEGAPPSNVHTKR